MQDRSPPRIQPPKAPVTSSSLSGFQTTSAETGTTETGTTRNTRSSTHSSSTNFGLLSLQSDCSDVRIGSEMTPEEIQWLKLAHEFTAAEKPFKEQKPFRVGRKLRTWHPKRGVTWSFLRRLYNGRQDIKENELANIANLSINDKK